MNSWAEEESMMRYYFADRRFVFCVFKKEQKDVKFCLGEFELKSRDLLWVCAYKNNSWNVVKRVVTLRNREHSRRVTCSSSEGCGGASVRMDQWKDTGLSIYTPWYTPSHKRGKTLKEQEVSSRARGSITEIVMQFVYRKGEWIFTVFQTREIESSALV